MGINALDMKVAVRKQKACISERGLLLLSIRIIKLSKPSAGECE